MVKVLKFGTDGWRAVIAEDFTFDNVKRVAAAIGLYLKEQNLKGPVFIGYDTRFLSEKFAEKVGEVLSSQGIEVWLGERFYPTPVTAFATAHFKLSGSVMITASHNPYYYNGLKFIPSYGGPAGPEITSRIEELIPERVDRDAGTNIKGEVKKFDPWPAYLEQLKKVVDLDLISRSNLKVVFDPNYGAAIGLWEKIFSSSNLSFTLTNNERDPYFGGSSPDPSRENLSRLLKVVREDQAQAGFALDGDADRFGVVEAPDTIFNTNELLAILAYYLVEYKRLRGNLVRTVATTHLLDRLAEKYGLKLVETPVGFKYIAGVMIQDGLLLGGEESGGLTVGGHIPEKDGLLAVLLCLEVLAQGFSFSSLKKELEKTVGAHISHRFDLTIDEAKKGHIRSLIDNFNDITAAEKLGDFQVKKVLKTDGLKVVLDDSSWFLVRLSGTEPVVRLYVEAANESKINLIKEYVLRLLEAGD